MITRWGERTLAVSEDIRDYLGREYGIPSSQVDITINGIDMEKFSPDVDHSAVERELGLDPSHRKIVYISRIDHDRSAPPPPPSSTAALPSSPPDPKLRSTRPAEDRGSNTAPRRRRAQARQRAAAAGEDARISTALPPWRISLSPFRAARSRQCRRACRPS